MFLYPLAIPFYARCIAWLTNYSFKGNSHRTDVCPLNSGVRPATHSGIQMQVARSRVATICLVLIAASQTSAADWKPLSHLDTTPGGGPGAQVEYDAATFTRTGEGVAVWERFTYDSPKAISGTPVSVVMVLNHYNCKTQTYYASSFRVFNTDGALIYSTDQPDAPRPLSPSSEGYYKLALFCKRSNKSSQPRRPQSPLA